MRRTDWGPQQQPGLTMPILSSRKQEVLTQAFPRDQYANSVNAKIEADAWQRWIDLHRPWNVTDSVEDVTSGSFGCVISLTHQLGVESGVAPLSPSLSLSLSLPLSEQTDDNDHRCCGSGGTQVKMNAIKKWMSCNLWRKVNVWGFGWLETERSQKNKNHYFQVSVVNLHLIENILSWLFILVSVYFIINTRLARAGKLMRKQSVIKQIFSIAPILGARLHSRSPKYC